jgi:DNA polymerase III epsilon subunit-like protein
MELVIDTETTGLTSLSFATERNFHKWPRLVQLAWGFIIEGTFQIQNNAIIQPVGFKIPYNATCIHGITQAKATEAGEALQDQLLRLAHAMQQADTIIAHNLNYDLGVIQSEGIRLDYPFVFPNKRRCTAFMGQTYLRKEKKIRLSEYPRLSDLHQQLLGYDYEPKHHAASDVIACANVYKELQRLGYKK